MAHSEPAFLGTGWSFPPTFLRSTRSVVMVSGDADIHESLRILFSTQIGERLMVPMYGTDLWRRVFSPMNTTFETEIANSVRTSILRWEPRIDVIDILVDADPAVGGLVVITVNYVVRATNSR